MPCWRASWERAPAAPFTGIAVVVIHGPDSPVDAGGKQYLNQVATKIRALGFPNVSVRRS